MIKSNADNGRFVKWKGIYNDNFNELFAGEFIFVFGLYSRHGNFYPPYNYVPDINWKELIQNFSY